MKANRKHQEDSTVPRRSYPYGRESGERQSGGDGPKRQADWFETVCEREHWTPDDSYHFFDMGKSGFHGEHLGPNGHLTRFLDLVRSGTITSHSVLVIDTICRLSRQEVDLAHDVFREIIRAGVWICTKTPDRIYKRESANLMDLMEPIWLFYLAYQESLKKSNWTKHSREEMREAARKGVKRSGKLPPWLVAAEDENGVRRYEIREDRKRSILKAIELSVEEGMGVFRVAEWLNKNAADYPPWGYQQRKGVPLVQRWRGATLVELFKNRSLVGEWQPMVGYRSDKEESGPPIPDYYPALLTEDEWRVLQAATEGRQNGKPGGAGRGRAGDKEANLFTGKIFEARTKSSMCIRQSSPSGYLYRSLVANVRAKLAATGFALPYPQVEAGLLRSIGELKTQDVLPADSARRKKDERIAKLEKRRIALQQRAAEINSQMREPEYKGIMADLGRNLVEIREEEKRVSAERDRLRLESRTSRGEQLAETQSIIEMLEKAKGTPQEAEMRRRLKASIGWLIESVWILIQPIGGRKYVGHAHIYLQGGRSLYRQLLPATFPAGADLWQLGGCDFRAGDIGDAAREAEPGLQPISEKLAVG